MLTYELYSNGKPETNSDMTQIDLNPAVHLYDEYTAFSWPKKWKSLVSPQSLTPWQVSLSRQHLLPHVDKSLIPLCGTFFDDFQKRLERVKLKQCPPAKALSDKALDVVADNFSALLRASANADLRNKQGRKKPLLESEHRQAWDHLLFDFFRRSGDDIEAIA